MNTEHGGHGIGNDMTESEWQCESWELHVQLAGHACGHWQGIDALHDTEIKPQISSDMWKLYTKSQLYLLFSCI
jgi:hypothetical protein